MEATIAVKVCGHCRAEKPLAEFYPCKQVPSGISSWCKACHSAHGKEQHRKRLARKPRPPAEDHPPGTKKCSRCKAWKPPGEFARHRRFKDGLRKWCRDCEHAADLAYRLAHPEQIRDRQRRRRREGYYRDWYATLSPEMKERMRGRHGDIRHAIRARLYGCEGEHTADQWRALCEHFGNRCARCRKPRALERDHVIPMKKGGSNGIANIQPLCRSCNARKHKAETDYRDPERLAAFLSRLGGVPNGPVE